MAEYGEALSRRREPDSDGSYHLTYAVTLSAPVVVQSRSSSLILVFDLVCASTFFTITAQ